VRSTVYYVEYEQGPPENQFVSIAIRFCINAFALWLASQWVTGFTIDGAWSLIAMAVIFGLVNAFIKPFVMLLGCPLIIITLGLFTLLINAGLLAFSAWIGDVIGLNVEVDGFWAAFLGALLISFVSVVLSLALNPIRRKFAPRP
jgi:putative membrane protein